jgi:hypothetical protein
MSVSSAVPDLLSQNFKASWRSTNTPHAFTQEFMLRDLS